MTSSVFINDWHTIINFGVHKGKRLVDVPQDYYLWLSKNCKYGVIYEAISRINDRRGVTSLIKDIPVFDYVPLLVEDTNIVLPIIERPDDVDVCLFGNFVEFLVKHSLGIKQFNEVNQYLAFYGLSDMPKDLKLNGDTLKPNRRTGYIFSSFKKQNKTILDICNISFCPSLLQGDFSEKKASVLYNYVKENSDYYDSYVLTLQNFPSIPKFVDFEQETCDKISVGCIIGVIDAIHKDSIIDIKCCIKDDINYYRKQLFTYACLHLLRYGKYFNYCKIYNFMKGLVYVMDVSKLTTDIAKHHIRTIGQHNQYHVKLLE
jgi:uncharacterized protein (DUF3820 family)